MATPRSRVICSQSQVVAADLHEAVVAPRRARLGARIASLFLALLILRCATQAGAQQQAAAPPTATELARSWPSFRGPQGSGVSVHRNIPVKWNGASGQGILWKTATPLPGTNSPVVWKDRIFLSGATRDRREVYCFDRLDGAMVWRKQVTGKSADAAQPFKVSSDTGFAAPTMATDGRRVYAMFANGDVVSFDFSGNQIWVRSLGVPKNHYGHASSLATYGGRVIVQLDQGKPKDEHSKLMALEGETGETVWEVARATPPSWCSPIIVRRKRQSLIVTGGDPWVIAYEAQSGKEIWRADCLAPAEVGPSPIYSQGTVFATSDFSTLAAIRADGAGDVSRTHIAWKTEDGLPDVCSPLATDQFILLLTSYGTLTCLDKSQGGDPLWEEEFDDRFVSSPSLVDQRVYLFARNGKSWIVEPTRQGCKRISESALGEECVTSPAFQDGRIYIRGKKHLFCIGKQ